MPGQDKAINDHMARLKDGHSEKLSLSLLYEKGFQTGQTIFVEVMDEAKSRCPICGSKDHPHD